MCVDPGPKTATDPSRLGEPHDCSKLKDPVFTPPSADEDFADSYGLGQPGSEAARQSPPVRFDRREARPYFVR